MRISTYNWPTEPPARRFDNGIAWVMVLPRRRRPRALYGWGLWFSRWFPWVWLLTPWTAAPDFAHDRAERKAEERRK